jgi:hypothetical protein
VSKVRLRMDIRRFRDKAGKEFAINCDLVQSWTASGEEFTVARFSTGDPITVQGALDKILCHVSEGTVETNPPGHATPPATSWRDR